MKIAYLCLLGLILAGCSTAQRSTNSSSATPTGALAADGTRYHHELISESAEGKTDFLVLAPGE